MNWTRSKTGTRSSRQGMPVVGKEASSHPQLRKGKVTPECVASDAIGGTSRYKMDSMGSDGLMCGMFCNAIVVSGQKESNVRASDSERLVPKAGSVLPACPAD